MSFNCHLYALTACEASADTLGAALMRAISRHDDKAKFIGIGGPKMTQCGLNSAFKMEELAVMGLTEVVSHLPKILKIRKAIASIIIEARPCVYIGIDAPDFNLSVERKVKAQGIPVIHYVSPSVWAWREGRLKKIKESCDEVLALLPFEKEYYDKAGMPCTYVGHTLASSIPLEPDDEGARERIDLKRNCVNKIRGKVMGIMPGSRAGIIKTMLPVYAQTARIIKHKLKDTVFISAAPTPEIAALIKDLWLEHAPDLSLTIYTDNAQDVMASCDALLLTCGTVTLEAMLLKKPMCVAYKVSKLSAAIAKHLLKVDTFSLPNLLAKRRIVSEYIQDDCTPRNLSDEMVKLLTSDNLLMKKEFLAIHKHIRVPSDEYAAAAVFRLIREKGSGESAQPEPQGIIDPYALQSRDLMDEINSLEEKGSDLTAAPASLMAAADEEQKERTAKQAVNVSEPMQRQGRSLFERSQAGEDKL